MPFCANCGQALEANSTFCSKCGASQTQTDLGSPDEHLNRGNALYDEGRTEEALVEFDTAARQNPNVPLYHLQKGMALWRLEGYQETPDAKARYSQSAKAEFKTALNLYQAVLRQEPNNPFHHYNISRTFVFLGKEKDALREIDLAISLDPNEAAFHYYKGLVLTDLKKPRDAIVELDTTLKLNPTHANCLVMKAKVYAGLGMKEEGAKVLNDSLRILEGNDERLGEFWSTLSEDVGGQSLSENERGVLEPFFFREMLGIARQTKPSELLR